MAAVLTFSDLDGAAMPPDEVADVVRPPAALDLSEAFVLERRLLQTRIERLSAIIREHGLELDQEDPRLGVSDGEHLQACARVVIAAYAIYQGEKADLEGAKADLGKIIGTSKELLGPDRWRKE